MMSLPVVAILLCVLLFQVTKISSIDLSDVASGSSSPYSDLSKVAGSRRMGVERRAGSHPHMNNLVFGRRSSQSNTVNYNGIKNAVDDGLRKTTVGHFFQSELCQYVVAACVRGLFKRPKEDE